MPIQKSTTLTTAFLTGQLILTPNSRLKRALLKSWAQENGSGLAPNILSLGEWIHQLWLQLQASAFHGAERQLITPSQSGFIWQKVIQQHTADGDLISPQQLSQNAESALKHLNLWRIELESLAEHKCDSGTVFTPWAEAFNEALEQRGLATTEFAIETMIKAGNSHQLNSHRCIYLYAFEQLPPLHKALIESLADETIGIKPSVINSSSCQQVTLASFEEEVQAAAKWAQAKLKQNKKSRIGVVALNLGQSRNCIERIFTETFEPQALLASTPSYTLPLNFSAGVPLASTPLICDALQLLNLQQESWPLDDICQLLNSPFFSDSEREIELRCELVEQLRRLGKSIVSGSELRYRVERIQRRNSTDTDDDVTTSLSSCLQAFSAAAKRQPKHCSAGHWAEHLQQQLQVLGWPGSRVLNSHEHQQMSQWLVLLQEFKRLDSCGYPLTHSSAISALRALCQNHHFQAQTPDSPIHILGALEGAGLTFDACWILGVGARNWPCAPSPNPLLPITLQRQHNMPHASAERELHIAQQLTLSYQHCAKEVIFSSASLADGNSDHPSPLIAHFQKTDVEPLLGSDYLTAPSFEQYQTSIRAAQQLQKFEDFSGPAITSVELSHLRGGSALFRDQASCPLIAFARHRLGAKSLPATSKGLSAIDRGNIIHAVLEQVWIQLKTSSQLRALDDQALQKLCKKAIETALTPYKKKLIQQLPEAFFMLEAERLLQLATAWLKRDLERPDFKVVACEAKINIVFEGLPLELRLDRLDQLSDGELLLIDYKTGKPQLSQWQGERPAEPQLPLYALSAQFDNDDSGSQEIVAIAFARIDKSDSELLGLGNLTESLSGKLDGISQPEECPRLDLPESWADVKTFWQQTLAQLATDFKNGRAEIDYRDANAQRYSEDYHPLTRIHERDQINNYRPQHLEHTPAASEKGDLV